MVHDVIIQVQELNEVKTPRLLTVLKCFEYFAMYIGLNKLHIDILWVYLSDMGYIHPRIFVYPEADKPNVFLHNVLCIIIVIDPLYCSLIEF